MTGGRPPSPRYVIIVVIFISTCLIIRETYSALARAFTNAGRCNNARI